MTFKTYFPHERPGRKAISLAIMRHIFFLGCGGGFVISPELSFHGPSAL